MIIQGLLIKRKPGQTCPFLLNLTSIWIHLCIICLEGSLLFPMVPRYVGSVMSVNKNEHFKNRFTIWLCTKMLSLRMVPSLWYLPTLFPNSWFCWNQTTRKLVRKPVYNLLQATCSIPFSHSEKSLLFCELHHEVCWHFKSAIAQK